MSRKRGNRSGMMFEERRLIDQTRTWFVVNVLTAQEGKIADDIRDAGGDVWLPRFRTVVRRQGRRMEIERRFFPSYLFAGLRCDGAICPVRPVILDTEGVIDVLGTPNPLPIPAGVVQAIADRLTGDVQSERIQAAALYKIGEMRPVMFGPFSSFYAQVTELLQSGRIKADVQIFGRATPVEFDPKDLGTPLTSQGRAAP